jgi:hypothetical protein
MRRFAFLLCMPFLLAGCGSGENKGATNRSLSAEEAAQLANVQYTNFQAKGATFELNSAFNETGDTLLMRGQIDWVNHAGHVSIYAQGSEAMVTEVIWTPNAVFERRPALDELLKSIGKQEAKYIMRPVNVKGRQIDRAISILVGLASSQADNALLTQQKEGSAFMRNDKLRGIPIDVLRFGQNSRYWLEQGTSILRRFDANAESGLAPIVIDFFLFGAQQIIVPDEKYVVRYEEIQEIFDAPSS